MTTINVPAPIRLEGRGLLISRLLYGLLLLICVIAFSLSLYAKFFDGTSDCDWVWHKEWVECGNWFSMIHDLGLTPTTYEGYFLALRIVAALPFFALSLLLIWRRGYELRVWLLAGLLLVLAIAGTWFTPFWEWMPGIVIEETKPLWILLIVRTLNFMLFAGMVLFAFLFPDGRFVPRWTRPLVALWLLLIAGNAYFPNSPVSYWSLPSPLPQLLQSSIAVIAIATMIWRYRKHADPTQRQQIKWVTAGLLLLAFNYLLDFSVWEIYPVVTGGSYLIPTGREAVIWELFQDSLWYFSQIIFAFCIGLAVFRRRLWDIDIILSRTLVYGSLTALIVALYILIVGGIGLIFESQTNAIAGLAATGVIAVLFQPLRDRLQRGVERLLYGERNNPALVLTQLAHHLESGDSPAAILPNLVQTIAHTLKIPHVAIWTPTAADQMETLAAWGAKPTQVETLPLTYQNQLIGQLVVAPRSPDEQLTRHERELLTTIAALTATTLRAVQLSDELRQSRQRIVSAREEERRRLRRDLHDGLGPQLASQTLGIEAVEHLLTSNPQKATSLLASLKTQAQEAILDVRRLVYELRPPALDDLGLIGALQQSATRYEVSTLHFSFEVPDPLPDLPAAVEIAVFRIAQEAMTNVVRHAQATACTVRLFCADGKLILQVRDNGCGLPQDKRAGVGLQAMKERAAELNGQCMIESLPDGGTQVEARLPLEVNDAQ